MAKTKKFAVVDRRERTINYEFGSPTYKTRKYKVLLEATSTTDGTVKVWHVIPKKFWFFKWNKKELVGSYSIKSVVENIRNEYGGENFYYSKDRNYWGKILNHAFSLAMEKERESIESDYEYRVRISNGYRQKLSNCD